MTTLIPDEATFKLYMPLPEKFAFSLLPQHQRKAARNWLIPFMGTTLWEELKAGNFTENTEAYNEALSLAREAEAQLTFNLFIPFSGKNLASNGFFKISDQNRKALNNWDLEELAQDHLESALSAMDSLYTHCLDKGISTFSHRKVSWLVPTALEFSEFYEIRNSGRTYLQMSSIIRKEERTKVLSRVPDTLIEELKNVNNPLGSSSGSGSNGTQSQLLELLKSAVCHFTIAKASKELTCKLDGDAFLVTEFAGPHMQKKSEANLQRIMVKGEEALKDAESIMNEVDVLIQKEFSSHLPEESTIQPATIHDAGGIVSL